MTIRWFSDEDRARMREDKRIRRTWDEFWAEYAEQHFGMAVRGPMTAEDLERTDRLSLLKLDPWRRSGG